MFGCMSYVRILIVPEGCKHKDGRDEGNQRGSVTSSVHLPESGIIWCLEHRDKHKRKYYRIISRELSVFYQEILQWHDKSFHSDLCTSTLFVVLEVYSLQTNTKCADLILWTIHTEMYFACCCIKVLWLDAIILR